MSSSTTAFPPNYYSAALTGPASTYTYPTTLTSPVTTNVYPHYSPPTDPHHQRILDLENTVVELTKLLNEWRPIIGRLADVYNEMRIEEEIAATEKTT